jgi:adenine-specific DNA methylase
VTSRDTAGDQQGHPSTWSSVIKNWSRLDSYWSQTVLNNLFNFESLISKDEMIELLSNYGTVSHIEKDYKRFKSFDYNEDKPVVEYLFCVKF